MKKLGITLMLCAGMLGVGAIGASTTSVTPVKARRIYIAKNVPSTNTYWRNRTARFAQQRRKYYNKQVGYNFRGLGGLTTSDGKYQIKRDKLFRSNHLPSNESKAGVREIHRLHITHDIDLRYMRGRHSFGRSIQNKPQPGEFGLAKDPHHLRMHYIYDPVQSYANERNRRNNSLYAKYGEPYDFTYNYTQTRQAHNAYRSAIYDMTRYYNKHRAIMSNCTAGRDRTGTLSIITESVLGISKRNIFDDFMLSNYYKKQYNGRKLITYSQQAQRIDTFYKTINHLYGNMNRYITRVIGISKPEIRLMRRDYLTRVR